MNFLSERSSKVLNQPLFSKISILFCLVLNISRCFFSFVGAPSVRTNTRKSTFESGVKYFLRSRWRQKNPRLSKCSQSQKKNLIFMSTWDSTHSTHSTQAALTSSLPPRWTSRSQFDHASSCHPPPLQNGPSMGWCPEHDSQLYR